VAFWSLVQVAPPPVTDETVTLDEATLTESTSASPTFTGDTGRVARPVPEAEASEPTAEICWYAYLSFGDAGLVGLLGPKTVCTPEGVEARNSACGSG